jgi:hypothetical protein
MIKRIYIGLMLILIMPCRNAWCGDAVIVSVPAGECTLSVEANDEWHTLRLRAHHPQYKSCHITEDEMIASLEAAFLKTETPSLKGDYSSLSIGRLIDFPWLSQYLADAAYSNHQWNSKKGKPVTLGFNNYVAHILFNQKLLASIQKTLANAGYRIVGMSVEKVLVGGFRKVPSYRGDHVRGLVPCDAQVWFRLQKN